MRFLSLCVCVGALTMLRKSTFLSSFFSARSQAAAIIAFMHTSTGRISAGKSALQCIDRTTPEIHTIKNQSWLMENLNNSFFWAEMTTKLSTNIIYQCVKFYLLLHQLSIQSGHSYLQPNLRTVLSKRRLLLKEKHSFKYFRVRTFSFNFSKKCSFRKEI